MLYLAYLYLAVAIVLGPYGQRSWVVSAFGVLIGYYALLFRFYRRGRLCNNSSARSAGN